MSDRGRKSVGEGGQKVKHGKNFEKIRKTLKGGKTLKEKGS